MEHWDLLLFAAAIGGGIGAVGGLTVAMWCIMWLPPYSATILSL